MKKHLKKHWLLGSLFLTFWLGIGIFYATTTAATLPLLQDGDLIFQTSRSNQSKAIFIATQHPYTHMGIIRHRNNTIYVMEAAGKVQETPLNIWINQGFLQRVAVYRMPNLSSQQVNRILASATHFYGKPYDKFFSFQKDALYCSELPYYAYHEAGIALGKVQTLSELNFDNFLVKQLIRERWKLHPECRAQHYSFEQCYAYILAQPLITPASIGKDAQLQPIYSNYPFHRQSIDD
jgi:hypothetical protein